MTTLMNIRTSSQIAKTFLKPQVKSFVEDTLNRSVRLNSVNERGCERCQISVTKEERELLINAWSKLTNCKRVGIGETYEATVGDLFFEKGEDRYKATIVNTLYNRGRRFAFEFYLIK